jgi:8-oxo-dGTP pyrophosphatase MutT (NUDIX family)
MATFVDRMAQTALGVAYRLSLAWVRLIGRPRHAGAAVIVRHGGRILMVRHSYRAGYGLPGGNVRRGEAPVQAAARELREEVGIVAEPSALTAIYATRDLHVFAYRPTREPAVRIDNREIVEAAFFETGEAVKLHRDLRYYLRSAGG